MRSREACGGVEAVADNAEREGLKKEVASERG